MSRTGGVDYVVPPEWLRLERDDDQRDEHDDPRENVHTRAPFRLPHEPDGERRGAEGAGLSDQNGR